MSRFLSVSIIGLMVMGLANAGYITTDLATAKGSLVAGATTTTITGTGTATFVNTLFSTTMPSPAVPPTPSAAPQYFGNSSINSVPFVLDSNASGSAEFLSPNAASMTTSLVINMGGFTGANATAGIFGVDKLYTMLNATRASLNYQGITITLDGVAGDGVTAVSNTFKLTAGVDYRANNTQAAGIQTTVDGVSTNTEPAAPAASTSVQTNLNNSMKIYNSAFLSPGTGPNNFWLDVQEMDLPGLSLAGSFVGGYLDTVTITSVAGENISGPSQNNQRLMLAGLTVESVPEPATFFMLSTGLAAIALKFRRRKQ